MGCLRYLRLVPGQFSNGFTSGRFLRLSIRHVPRIRYLRVEMMPCRALALSHESQLHLANCPMGQHAHFHRPL